MAREYYHVVDKKGKSSDATIEKERPLHYNGRDILVVQGKYDNNYYVLVPGFLLEHRKPFGSIEVSSVEPLQDVNLNGLEKLLRSYGFKGTINLWD